MSTSTGRKSDRSRRRRNQEDNDEQHRERDSTPRGFGHRPATYPSLEELEEGVEQCHLDDERSDSEDGGDDPRGSHSSDRILVEIQKGRKGQDIYEYDTETSAPESEMTASSSRYYTTARAKDSTSNQVAWQPNYTHNTGPSQIEDISRDVTSAEYFARLSSPVSAQGGSYQTSQPLTKFSPSTVSQGVYIGLTVLPDDEDSPDHPYDSANDGNQQMSINISGSDITTQSSQLPPVFIPPPTPCGCDSGEHLCGVIIFPHQSSPKNGKISSKRSKGKTGSSSASGSGGSGSGSGKRSAKGSNGSGCGPIVMPGITPSPRPQPPPENASKRDWKAYEQQIYDWEEGYKNWKHITCPCRRGYFDEDGKWVSGEDVRRGTVLPNPRWESTNGIAPDSVY
ncbi:hypothetical protein DL98DRAFT_639651 [Cadophora sp. DSE1049]|nr:hypothetical protein DL98DRAFT_639651 [Cadophora sp. DSE1049]